MRRALAGRLALPALAAALGGCAAAVPGYVPPTPQSAKMKAAVQTGGGFDQSGSYAMTDQEQKLDCKHLTGGITVKILQMRDSANRYQPSSSSQAVQKNAAPLLGGSTYGADTSADFARDRARIETLNRQLVSKGCKSFDIEAELKSGNTNPPSPTVEARKDVKPDGKKKKG